LFFVLAPFPPTISSLYPIDLPEPPLDLVFFLLWETESGFHAFLFRLWAFHVFPFGFVRLSFFREVRSRIVTFPRIVFVDPIVIDSPPAPGPRFPPPVPLRNALSLRCGKVFSGYRFFFIPFFPLWARTDWAGSLPPPFFSGHTLSSHVPELRVFPPMLFFNPKLVGLPWIFLGWPHSSLFSVFFSRCLVICTSGPSPRRNPTPHPPRVVPPPSDFHRRTSFSLSDPE